MYKNVAKRPHPPHFHLFHVWDRARKKDLFCISSMLYCFMFLLMFWLLWCIGHSEVKDFESSRRKLRLVFVVVACLTIFSCVPLFLTAASSDLLRLKNIKHDDTTLSQGLMVESDQNRKIVRFTRNNANRTRQASFYPTNVSHFEKDTSALAEFPYETTCASCALVSVIVH